MRVIEITLENRRPIMSFFYALVLVLNFGFVVKLVMDDPDEIVNYKLLSAGWLIFKVLFYGNVVWLNISSTVMGRIHMKKSAKNRTSSNIFKQRNGRKIGYQWNTSVCSASHLRQFIIFI